MVLLASSIISIVLCLVGFSSPQWLVRVNSSIRMIPVDSVGLWTMEIDKYAGLGEALRYLIAYGVHSNYAVFGDF